MDLKYYVCKVSSSAWQYLIAKVKKKIFIQFNFCKTFPKTTLLHIYHIFYVKHEKPEYLIF